MRTLLWSAKGRLALLFNFQVVIKHSLTGQNGGGGLAQLGERLPCTQEAIGSNPFISTNHGLIAQLVRARA